MVDRSVKEIYIHLMNLLMHFFGSRKSDFID